jgi:predicted tellurium resistance membrane protein TerC
MSLDDPLLWTALLKIIGVNIVLSGDNAVVIAAVGAIIVVAAGQWLAHRAEARAGPGGKVSENNPAR